MHVAKYWRNKALYYRLNDKTNRLHLQASIESLEQNNTRVKVYSGNSEQSEERSNRNG